MIEARLWRETWHLIEQFIKRWQRFHLDRAGRDWYWREPEQLPFMHGPYRTRLSAWLAAWRATR